MRAFDDIYKSLKPDFSPQPRGLKDLAFILSKAYELINDDDYKDFSLFDNTTSAIDIDRTTIERLIMELNSIKQFDKGTYCLQSEGIEKAIASIKELDEEMLKSSFSNRVVQIMSSAELHASLLYIIDISRQGVILSKKKQVLDNITRIEERDEVVNYLNSVLCTMKQNECFWDKLQYNFMLDFIELELKKWENKIVKEIGKSFKSNMELGEYIVKLINRELIHDIRYEEGYRVFWRDELCVRDPKKEPEIHHYIKTILKPYCDNVGIRITRENAIANGYIDMTFSYLNYCICLEVKKAQHQDVGTAINTQLTKYMDGERSDFGIYLILWYKSSHGYKHPQKYDTINDLFSSIVIDNDMYKYEIMGVDCSRPISPSKRS